MSFAGLAVALLDQTVNLVLKRFWFIVFKLTILFHRFCLTAPVLPFLLTQLIRLSAGYSAAVLLLAC